MRVMNENERRCVFRFYEELNDFLPEEKKKTSFSFDFSGTPSVKDSIEALGAPHTEVDLIVVDGRSVGFDYLLQGGERVAVYPVFEGLDISSLQHLRPAPLRETRFVLDVHLGKVARYLRLAGFDTIYNKDLDDPQLAEISQAEERVLLTRDLVLLKRRTVTRGYWVRSQDPTLQLREVIRRFDLSLKQFLGRCAECNGEIRSIAKEAIEDRLEENTKKYYTDFYICTSCGNIYWEGSHVQAIARLFSEQYRASEEFT